MFKILISILGAGSVAVGGMYIAHKTGIVDFGMFGNFFSSKGLSQVDFKINHKDNLSEVEFLQGDILLAEEKFLKVFATHNKLKMDLNNKLAENFDCFKNDKDFQEYITLFKKDFQKNDFSKKNTEKTKIKTPVKKIDSKEEKKELPVVVEKEEEKEIEKVEEPVSEPIEEEVKKRW